MAKILLIRFSAFGDVAMMVPIVHSLAVQYPQHDITVLSRVQFAPLFATMPSNTHFLGVDLARDYAGISGLNKLYKELRSQNFDCVADFHGVLRSMYLRFCFFLSGRKTSCIHKGYKAKRKLTRMGYHRLKPLKTSFQRYADVLKRLGLPVSPQFTSIYGTSTELGTGTSKGSLSMDTLNLTGTKDGVYWIGIDLLLADWLNSYTFPEESKFSNIKYKYLLLPIWISSFTYKGKIYPLDKMQKVIESLSKKKQSKVFLFGGGDTEVARLDGWSRQYENVVSVAGRLPLEQELALISHLDLMVSMDSANMHLASLVGTPVLSVWGATHPYAGFLGWNQSETNTIQKDLPCRPCSVFGNKPCRFNNYDCLQIQPQSILRKIDSLLS
mgnify:CR=1 FL=1